MTDPATLPRAAVIAWIERRLGAGARVTRVEELPPSSTTLHVIEVTLADTTTLRLLLRRYHDAARLVHDPWYVPAQEARALELLADTPVPAPRLVAADLEGAVGGVPAIVESWLPGGTSWRPDDLERYLARSAEALVAIHHVHVPRCMPAYSPYHEWATTTVTSSSRCRNLWERVGAALDRPPPSHREAFIHRDYHPGNVLWDGSEVTGVVDWATGAWGPPGIDLARMRQNLALMHGREVADRFSVAYVEAGGDVSARHPFWDLLDAADLLPDIDGFVELDRGALERWESYVEAVLAEL